MPKTLRWRSVISISVMVCFHIPLNPPNCFNTKWCNDDVLFMLFHSVSTLPGQRRALLTIHSSNISFQLSHISFSTEKRKIRRKTLFLWHILKPECTEKWCKMLLLFKILEIYNNAKPIQKNWILKQPDLLRKKNYSFSL